MPMLRRWLSTGRLLPAVLAAVGLADVVTRGLPIDALAFRAWEAMVYYREPGAAFEAHAGYDRWSYGDLANIANLPAYRIYRRERWTTDEYGFRNPPGLAASGRVQALLVGDSFAAGSGVADDDTLSAQLTARGVPTYNVAPLRLSADATRAVAGRLGMAGGWVLYEQVAGLRYVHLDPASVTPRAPDAMPPLTFAARFARNVGSATWPLRIAAERWLKRWQDNRWFANPYRHTIEIRRLSNGDSMLFFSGEALARPLPPQAVAAIAETVAIYRTLHASLAAHGLRLAVILVPDRFALYAHLIDGSAWAGGPSPYLETLDRELHAAGIPTVNVYPAMAEQVTREADAFRYLYWLDDTHWNGRGIAITADVVASYLRARP